MHKASTDGTSKQSVMRSTSRRSVRKRQRGSLRWISILKEVSFQPRTKRHMRLSTAHRYRKRVPKGRPSNRKSSFTEQTLSQLKLCQSKPREDRKLNKDYRSCIQRYHGLTALGHMTDASLIDDTGLPLTKISLDRHT